MLQIPEEDAGRPWGTAVEEERPGESRGADSRGADSRGADSRGAGSRGAESRRAPAIPRLGGEGRGSVARSISGTRPNSLGGRVASISGTRRRGLHLESSLARWRRMGNVSSRSTYALPPTCIHTRGRVVDFHTIFIYFNAFRSDALIML